MGGAVQWEELYLERGPHLQLGLYQEEDCLEEDSLDLTSTLLAPL